MGPPGSGALSCLIMGWEHEAFRGLLENESLKFCLRKITVYYVPQVSQFLNSQMDV